MSHLFHSKASFIGFFILTPVVKKELDKSGETLQGEVAVRLTADEIKETLIDVFLPEILSECRGEVVLVVDYKINFGTAISAEIIIKDGRDFYYYARKLSEYLTPHTLSEVVKACLKMREIISRHLTTNALDDKFKETKIFEYITLIEKL